MTAALALSMGIAAPGWSLEDPMQENYTAHVIPFYKIADNWSAFLVVADTSFRDLDDGGSPIYMTFYKATLQLCVGRDRRGHQDRCAVLPVAQ